MEFKGTKGKWALEKNSHFYEVIKADGSYDFNAMIFCSRGNHSAESESNALLIAHAPEMLEMLGKAKYELEQFRDSFGQGSLLIDEIEQLINSATSIR